MKIEDEQPHRNPDRRERDIEREGQRFREGEREGRDTRR